MDGGNWNDGADIGAVIISGARRAFAVIVQCGKIPPFGQIPANAL